MYILCFFAFSWDFIARINQIEKIQLYIYSLNIKNL